MVKNSGNTGQTPANGKSSGKTLPLGIRLAVWIFAWEPWRYPGSRARLVMTRLVIYLTLILLAEACTRQWLASVTTYLLPTIVVCALSVGFFGYAVIAVTLMSDVNFHIRTRRLFGNTLLSSAFMILAFAHVYRLDGLRGGEASALDYVYFSAVTFSTLGFGDYAPADTAGRLCAALQAILGNLHLAVTVGAVFLRMSRRPPPKLDE